MLCKICERDYLWEKIRNKTRERIYLKFSTCYACYRKCVMRKYQAKTKGYDLPLSDFVNNPKYLRKKSPGKSKRYYQERSKLQRARAMPKWINIDSLCEIYANCPKGLSVDHIIPINGENVCGLHVPWNLQYLDKIANIKKGNKL